VIDRDGRPRHAGYVRGLGTRIVTISATFGAGGSVIAPQLAERLGLPFADRLVPARGSLASPSGEQLSEQEREEVRRRGFFSRLAHLTGGMGLPVPDAGDLRGPVREQVEASLHELARDPGAVILGRGGAVVLAGHPAAFHVRLDGPTGARHRQAMVIEDIDAATARDRQQETDDARRRFLNRVFERDPADPRLYQLVLDSTALPLAACVELIDAAATAFWGRER
jgi:cytidylate kinase